MSDDTDTAPPGALPAAERIATLDILRGFALMGILIMNLPGFVGSFFAESDGTHLWPGRADQIADVLRTALFDGKFNSMFSLLFGIGFTIQYARMQQRAPDQATALYLRRLLALLVFGVIHAVVFWPGDVLHNYALLGFVLVLGLRHASDRTLLILIVAALLMPIVNGLLRLQFFTPEVVARLVREGQAFEASNALAYGQGSFADMVRENARVMGHFYGSALSLWGAFGWYVMLGLTMLIGVLAGRRRWVQRTAELMPRIRVLTWWALALGLACGVAAALIFEFNRTPGPSPIKLLGGVCYSLSRVSMMLFYVLVIVRIAQGERGRRWLAPWQAAGRMPLTNYLMQTAIGLVLFRGWGLGGWMTVGPAWQMPLALAIFFGLQVPWSLWWLKRHERGPMEALWARLTYGRRAEAGAPARVTAARP